MVGETRRQYDELNKRLKELEFIIYKENNRHTIFDDIFDKIH